MENLSPEDQQLTALLPTIQPIFLKNEKWAQICPPYIAGFFFLEEGEDHFYF